MLNAVLVKTYAPPPIDEKEILRYAGHRGEADEGIKTLLKECLQECTPCISYRVCYRAYETETLKTLIGEGKTVCHYLQGCEYAVAFAATVGLEMDRLIQKYAVRSTAKALLFQAIGAERIESLCNAFCGDMATLYQKDGFFARPRFSPGYGDFPLLRQKELFSSLDCARKIGLSLTDSFLMTPSKSVTAVMGFSKTQTPLKTGCSVCEKKDCKLRKEE